MKEEGGCKIRAGGGGGEEVCGFVGGALACELLRKDVATVAGAALPAVEMVYVTGIHHTGACTMALYMAGVYGLADSTMRLGAEETDTRGYPGEVVQLCDAVTLPSRWVMARINEKKKRGIAAALPRRTWSSWS
jgi:hypothetical protein